MTVTDLKTAVKPNVLLIIGVAAAAQLIFLLSPFLETSGMAAIIVMWIPLMAGAVSLISFFLARLLVPHLAYLVTFLSIAMQIVLVVRGLLT